MHRVTEKSFFFHRSGTEQSSKATSDPRPIAIDECKAGESLKIDVDFGPNQGIVGKLLLTTLGDNLYRIEETPFLVDCAAYGDVVEAHSTGNGSLLFGRVVAKSAYALYDFMLPKAVIESGSFQNLLSDVLDAGGHWDIDFGSCVFIYLPNDCMVDPRSEIRDLLRQQMPSNDLK